MAGGMMDLDRRKGCDFGVSTALKVESDVFLLHRQGPNQTDMFRSDAAVYTYTMPESLALVSNAGINIQVLHPY